LYQKSLPAEVKMEGDINYVYAPLLTNTVIKFYAIPVHALIDDYIKQQQSAQYCTFCWHCLVK
jgi:hypothetical protein